MIAFTHVDERCKWKLGRHWPAGSWRATGTCSSLSCVLKDPDTQRIFFCVPPPPFVTVGLRSACLFVWISLEIKPYTCHKVFVHCDGKQLACSAFWRHVYWCGADRSYDDCNSNDPHLKHVPERFQWNSIRNQITKDFLGVEARDCLRREWCLKMYNQVI